MGTLLEEAAGQWIRTIVIGSDMQRKTRMTRFSCFHTLFLGVFCHLKSWEFSKCDLTAVLWFEGNWHDIWIKQ